MAYRTRLNASQSLSTNDAYGLSLEFDALRAELDDLRTKYAALVALLVAGTAPGAGYSAGTTLAQRQFTPT